jgi:hypothetical protein
MPFVVAHELPVNQGHFQLCLPCVSLLAENIETAYEFSGGSCLREFISTGPNAELEFLVPLKRGLLSLAAKSSSDDAPIAPSFANSLTGAGLRLNTTHP